ncbi:hypothetical protein PSHT_15835 [Puccinia striiformis]|uniref:Uncharacterized protein n=1 Tax=Puccinia striiformis TaxID=27350 RepID=A0A2S4UCU8_9BASI|nr:hypothetical protein PSHT_15835 [Puccinia striiformis]
MLHPPQPPSLKGLDTPRRRWPSRASKDPQPLHQGRPGPIELDLGVAGVAATDLVLSQSGALVLEAVKPMLLRLPLDPPRTKPTPILSSSQPTSRTSVPTLRKSKTIPSSTEAVHKPSASRLSLNSKQLRQRIDAFKKKFVAAKNWMDNTGTGIEEGRHAHTLPALLEEKCACYDHMDVIFGANPNVTPLAQYESQCGMDLYGLNTNKDPDNDDLPPPESPEVYYFPLAELPPVPKEFSHRRPGAPASVTSSVWKGLESQFQLDLGASLSSTISNPSLTQVEGNDNNTLAGKNVAPTPTESPTGDSACPGPTPANTASQPANPEPVTNTARFPNQSTGDRSVPAPRRDNSQANKAKSSIAAAFEALTDKKFQYLDKHMAMETDKFSWEKEKYDNGKLRPSNGSLKAGQLPRSTCLNLST